MENPGTAPIVPGASVVFELPYATPSLNETKRMHWGQYARRRAAIAWDVSILTLGKRPASPFARAHIRVVRHGGKLLDADNATGGLKALLDVLQPFHATVRPNGLGIIASDAPGCLTLDVSQELAPRCAGKTVVTIEEIA